MLTDVYQVVVAVLLILVQNGINLRSGGLPVVRFEPIAAEILVQRLGVNLKWRVFADMAFDNAQNLRGDILGLIPVFLVPFLEDGYGRAGDFDVQLDVFGQAGMGEVR